MNLIGCSSTEEEDENTSNEIIEENEQEGDNSSDVLRPASVELLVMHNGGEQLSVIERLDSSLNRLNQIATSGNEGIAIDGLGNLYIANDLNAPPSNIQVMTQAQQRLITENNLQTDLTQDRQYTAIDSSHIKGIAITKSGMLLAANHLGNSIEIYGISAGEPEFPYMTLTTPASPWDLTYDEDTDRLFVALVDGSILVADNFVASDYSLESPRIIRPNADAEISNIHGIVYDASSDRLVVSDVGDAAVADDGKIYVIADASTAEGNITPEMIFEGSNTQLGNPVDIAMADGWLFIAEKSNDKLLAYENFFSKTPGNTSASIVVDFIKPESIALIPKTRDVLADISDIENNTPISSIAVTLNPAVPNGTPDLIKVDDSLEQLSTELFSSSKTLESMKLDSLGNAYITYDENGAGGILIINHWTKGRSDTLNTSLDRVITGANTQLISPKGLDIANELGWLFVTENSADAPSVKVFSMGATGNAAPLFSTTLPAAPWDADYEPSTDKLFVTLVNGTIAVFDEYSVNQGVNGANRIITPAVNGAAIPAPTNLHGIVYHAASQSLIVSDVGSGTIPTDGKIYIIEGGNAADGVTDIKIAISNNNNDEVGNTQLGNPVDIAFDGVNLYVAEKSQNQLLRFDNLLTSVGGDLPPNHSIETLAPESVALIPDYQLK
ncbi:MAG: hypothetical protein AAGB12_14610 [Pseudomonadota bacterium]